ncbi:hypothetical protein KY308_01265 [Candidatus Woesearchaeota archaeon]|nr:hypothetical protein [Candidatus Woesearchaeota archaeon]
MLRWETFESFRFHFGLRNTEQHPELVERTKELIKLVPEKQRCNVVSDLLILIANETGHKRYGIALQKYNAHYAGMSNKDLEEYIRYLKDNFEIE